MALYKCPKSNGYKYRLVIKIATDTPTNFTDGIGYTKNSNVTGYSIYNMTTVTNNLSDGITLTTKYFNEKTEAVEGSESLSASRIYYSKRDCYKDGATSAAAVWELTPYTFTCTFEKTSGGILAKPSFTLQAHVVAKSTSGSLGQGTKNLTYYNDVTDISAINISNYDNGDVINIGEISPYNAPQTASAGATTGTTYVCKSTFQIAAKAKLYMTATLEKVSA